MIETQKQLSLAIAEIATTTGWPLAVIGKKADVSHPTIIRIVSGETKLSGSGTMMKIERLQKRVRRAHGAVAAAE